MRSERDAMRERDELFEAMIDVLRLDASQLTRSERGRINRALAELREVCATPDQLRKRAAAYRRQWPDCTLTATAIAANWARLGPQPLTFAQCEARLQEMWLRRQRGLDVTHEAEAFFLDTMSQGQRNDPGLRAMANRLLEPRLKLA